MWYRCANGYGELLFSFALPSDAWPSTPPDPVVCTSDRSVVRFVPYFEPQIAHGEPLLDFDEVLTIQRYPHETERVFCAT